MIDEATVERLVAGLRELEKSEPPLDEAMTWLKEQGVRFGEAGEALARVLDVSTLNAYQLLHESVAWKAGSTRYRLNGPDGPIGELICPDGRRFAPGDLLSTPRPDVPVHEAEGLGLTWRVVAVGECDNATITADLTLERAT